MEQKILSIRYRPNRRCWRPQLFLQCNEKQSSKGIFLKNQNPSCDPFSSTKLPCVSCSRSFPNRFLLWPHLPISGSELQIPDLTGSKWSQVRTHQRGESRPFLEAALPRGASLTFPWSTRRPDCTARSYDRSHSPRSPHC